MCKSARFMLGKAGDGLCISRYFCTVFIYRIYVRGISAVYTRTNRFFIRALLLRKQIFSDQLNPFYAHYPRPLLPITTNLFNS